MRRHRRCRLLVPPRSAKLFVINRRKDGRIFAANRTFWIASQIKLSKFDLERIKVEQASDERFADAHNQFDRLDCLQHADNSRQNTEHSRLRAIRHAIWRRRLWKQAPVAWPAQVRREHCGLPLKTKDRTVDVRFACKNTDVIGQISRRKIIRAVHDHVVLRDKLWCVFARETALMQSDVDLRIDVTQAVARRLQFAAADVLCSVENLSLQIRKIDIVKIDEADRADASRRKIQSSRRSQTACTDAQNTRRFQT